ncbi:unnamed protein product [Soboliphyme baturini]|uniref:FERM domain-containing protein n=1 Tax=Soboliphyme baturini TaxID=241478 RepID=A0A183IWX3_9BILA|nr:unnamed protein product [Soboliphyme baturini]
MKVTFEPVPEAASSPSISDVSSGGCCDLSRDRVGVRFAELHCLDGKVLWRYPNGGLMIRFEPNLFERGALRFCIRFMRQSLDTALFGIDGNKISLFASNIKERANDNDDDDAVHCLTTNHTDVLLFMELRKLHGMTGFYYSVVPLNSSASSHSVDRINDVTSTCRQCSFSGTIMAMLHAGIVFPVRLRAGCSTEMYFGRGSKSEFLIVAKYELGRAVLVCAQPWSEWPPIETIGHYPPWSDYCNGHVAILIRHSFSFHVVI